MRYAAFRSNGATGVFTLLVGAWAGIVVFVGPVFGYDAQGKTAWVWSSNHAFLHLAPGAGAVLAGLLIMAALPRTSMSILASILAIAAGAWLVIGPLAWPVLEGAGHTAWAPAGPLHSLTNQVGANLGPGLLLVLLGSFAISASAAPAAEVALADGSTATTEPVIAA